MLSYWVLKDEVQKDELHVFGSQITNEQLLFVPVCLQMSMSASGPASAGPGTATTPSGTTPASAPWITCRSTGATTAWVGHAAAAAA